MEEKEGIAHSSSKYTVNSKYHTRDVQEKVVKLRDDGKTWESVTEVMREELNEPKMSRDVTIKIYNRAMAQTITTETRAGTKFKNFTKELNNMYGKSINVLEGYIRAAEGVSEELGKMIKDGDITAIKAYGVILKTAPQMKAITSEIRDFMKLQQDQQDKITIEQSALVWNEGQMIDYLNKYLKRLEKEGKIKIIQDMI